MFLNQRFFCMFPLLFVFCPLLCQHRKREAPAMGSAALNFIYFTVAPLKSIILSQDTLLNITYNIQYKLQFVGVYLYFYTNSYYHVVISRFTEL